MSGFLYQNGAQLATLSGYGPTPGANSVTFSSTVNAPVVAQVFDYAPGETVPFQLSLSGVAQSPAADAGAPAPSSTPVPAGTAGNPTGLAAPKSGALGGSPTGSYVYYTLDCPGDGSTQSVTLRFSPSGPDVASAIVLSVFQNGQQLVSDNGSHTSTPGQLTLSFSSQTAGPVLVQVANYSLWEAIDYTISR